MRELIWEEDERVIVSSQGSEDAAIIKFPAGKALVQSLDFFTPIVNNPYAFGQIAAANSMSDIYAMGAEPYTAMNIVCFPSKNISASVLKEILRGGLNKITEAGAIMAGGHSVDDQEIKYGLSVSGIVDPESYAINGGIYPGDQLLLTKPLGTGIIATAVKGDWPEKEELEALLWKWAGKLNVAGGQAIQLFNLQGATDVTGFGLGGHLLEMAQAGQMKIEIWSKELPVMGPALELASMGLVPAGSYANKNFCQCKLELEKYVDPLLVDIFFDAQTSGGLVLAVPGEKLDQVKAFLENHGDLAAHIGQVKEQVEDKWFLHLR